MTCVTRYSPQVNVVLSVRVVRVRLLTETQSTTREHVSVDVARCRRRRRRRRLHFVRIHFSLVSRSSTCPLSVIREIYNKPIFK